MVFAERTFSVHNSDGERMHGIIHQPPSSNGALIIMCNIGLHYRTCHARLFVRQARILEELGFTVIRFDTAKVGYSEGEINVKRAMDAYDSIQTGLFSNDLAAVIRYAEGQLGPQEIFLYGLCGGALTAIISAARIPSVAGVIFIAGPVTITSSTMELSRLHPFYAKLRIESYARKLFRLDAWWRFISGKSSYRMIYRSFMVRLKDLIGRFGTLKYSDSEIMPDPERNKGDIFNQIFFDSFIQIINSGRKILFVLPELDHATFDFDRIFSKKISALSIEQKSLVEIVRVSKANHTFSSAESSEKLLAIVSDWLNSNTC